MKELVIKGEAKTPTINFNFLSGELLISGRSIPENSVEFYEPIISWLCDQHRATMADSPYKKASMMCPDIAKIT